MASSVYNIIFQVSCCTGETKVLERLIAERQFDVDCLIILSNNEKTTAFVAAVQYRSVPVLKLLLENRARINSKDYSHCLYTAVCQREPELLKVLLQIDDQSDFKVTEDHYISSFEDIVYDLVNRIPEITPLKLRKICEQNCHKTIELILELGSQLFGKEGKKWNKCRRVFTLCKAIFENDLDKVEEILYERNFNYFKILSDDYRPASFAIDLKRSEITKLFVEELEKVEDIFFKSIMVKDLNLTKLCILKGVNFQARNISGKDALILACEYHNMDAVILFVEEYGMSFKRSCFEGQPPLFYAVRPKFIKDILNCFPHIINQRDHLGFTLLAIDPSCEIFKILLELGADPAIQNKLGEYPYHLCRIKYNHCNVMMYCRKMRLIDSNYVDFLLPKIFPPFAIQASSDVNITELDFIDEFYYDTRLSKYKEIQISRTFMSNTSQTLFDFIFYKPGKAARYSKNEVILELYKKCNNDFEIMCPDFGFLLNYQLRRGQRRRNLMDSARETLHFALSSELPDELTDELFKYFTDKEIEKLK